MLWGQHYFFSSGVIFLPLLLFALERYLREGKWLLLLSVIALLSLNMYFFYQIFIFVIIYYLFRVSSEDGFGFRKFLKTTGGFLVIVFLALSFSAALILPEYYLFQASPRTSVSGITSIFKMEFLFNFFDYYFSIFCRLFSNNLQGVGSSYIGFHNYYESMQLYCGLLFILLLPQAFILFNRKQKVVVVIGILLTLAFIIFPFFGRIMNGFQYATYRWGYNIIFAELMLLSHVMKNIIAKERVNYKLLFITGVVLVGCLIAINYQYTNEAEIYQYNLNKIWQSLGLIVIYIMAVYALTKQGVMKNIALAILLVSISVEMVMEHKDTFEKRTTLTKGMEMDTIGSKNSYQIDLFGYTKDVVSYLESIDDSFFRVEKNRWIASMNDSVVQGYKGLDSYNSLNTPSYFEFIDQLDIPPVPNAPVNLRMNILGWTSLQRPYLADLLSVKYYLTKDLEVATSSSEYMATIGDIHVFLRKEARPFGFIYDKYIDRETFFSMENDRHRDSLLLNGFLPPEKPEPILLLDEFTEISYKQSNQASNNLGGLNVLKLEVLSDDEMKGSIILAKKGMLFLSIPHDPGWSAKVNNKRVDIYKINIGFSGLLLNEGEQYIELRYRPPYLKEGTIISLISLFMILFLIFITKRKVILRSTIWEGGVSLR